MTILFVLDANVSDKDNYYKLKDCLEQIVTIFIREEFRDDFICKEAFSILQLKQ